MILNDNRYFFDPGRLRDHLPIVPTLEIDIFLNDFNGKSMLFRSRPLARSLADRPGARNSYSNSALSNELLTHPLQA